MTTTVVSWNIAKRDPPWRQLVEMDADVALLQETTGRVPREVAEHADAGPETHWRIAAGSSRALYDRWPMVARLSKRVEVEWFTHVAPISQVAAGEIAVSGIGTLAAARVLPQDSPPFIVVSMYARWAKPHPSTGSRWKVGYADGSAHRILSDLSVFIGDTEPSTHRILAAGDLNLIYGATDANQLALPARDRTVLDRMTALGLEFVGPQYPNGRQASLPPQGLPADTRNVPTYHTNMQTPATAENQLDYVFASRGFHEHVAVRALNGVGEWGASDHCRLLIEVTG